MVHMPAFPRIEVPCPPVTIHCKIAPNQAISQWMVKRSKGDPRDSLGHQYNSKALASLIHIPVLRNCRSGRMTAARLDSWQTKGG